MHASRGLIALLVGTVAFFALWIVALKPGGSGSGGSPTQGLSGYKSDIAAAHQAVQVSGADNARSGADPTASSSSSSAPAAHPSTVPVVHTTAGRRAAPKTNRHGAVRSTQVRVVGASRPASAASRLSQVHRAMSAHKAVAILFYNPAGADDQAVKQELAAVPTHRGRVVKLTVPLSEIANYTALTQQVPVNFSPTLVLVAPRGQADEIVGYSDQFEIGQRVDQALATR